MERIKYRLIFVLAILCLGCIISCGPPKPGIWKNADIKSSIRQDFHKRNEDVFKALNNNRPDLVSDAFGSDLLAMGSAVKDIEEQLTQHGKNGFKVLKEYYIVTDKAGNPSVKTDTADNAPFILKFNQEAREMYVSFLLPNEAADNKCMATLGWAKYKYGWRLFELSFEPYTINGKTAPQLFKLAKKLLRKNYLYDATLTAELAGRCSVPSYLWLYSNENDMRQLQVQLQNLTDQKYPMPITMSGVSTAPKIFNVFNSDTNEGTVTQIYYLSSINLNNYNALKQENDEIQKVIGQVIPGIDKDKKHLLFSAFNHETVLEKTMPSVDFMETFK